MGGRLEGKVALISGAARGQGAVHAELFAKEGASVVLGDILEKEVRFVADEIRAGEPRRSKPYFLRARVPPPRIAHPDAAAPGAWSPSPWRRPREHARGVQNPRLRLARGRSEAGGQTPADPSG